MRREPHNLRIEGQLENNSEREVGCEPSGLHAAVTARTERIGL